MTLRLTVATARIPSLMLTTPSSTFPGIFAAGGGAFNNNPAAVPGTVQAVNFDIGGPGVAYSPKATNNPKVRAGDQVEGGGGAVGYILDGDWVRYTVNAAAAGSYSVKVRFRSGTGIPLHVYMYH
jgi:beta-glucosidase